MNRMYMTKEIFRPLGIFILTNSTNPEFERIPVKGLGVGFATFSFDSNELKTDGSGPITLGFEVHGKKVPFLLNIERINEGEAKISWENLSFNYTLFNQWISGLDQEKKEALIQDVLSWEEEFINKAAEVELNSGKKAA